MNGWHIMFSEGTSWSEADAHNEVVDYVALGIIFIYNVNSKPKLTFIPREYLLNLTVEHLKEPLSGVINNVVARGQGI